MIMISLRSSLIAPLFQAHQGVTSDTESQASTSFSSASGSAGPQQYSLWKPLQQKKNRSLATSFSLESFTSLEMKMNMT